MTMNEIPPSYEVGCQMLQDAETHDEVTEAINIAATALVREIVNGITIPMEGQMVEVPDHKVTEIVVHEGKTESGQDSDKWYWQALAANGRVVAIGGEPFVTEWNAENAAKNLFPNAEKKKESE